MFESIITTGKIVTISSVMTVIIASIILGILIALAYIFTHKQHTYLSSFPITIVMLSIIVSIIILLVGNNVARAFSLAGAFSIIRFRSAPGDPKDVSYIFFTLGVGLACGMGYIGYAVIFTFVLCTVMIGLESLKFGVCNDKTMELKIIVPEDLNFDELFDDILQNYTNSWTLVRLRTRDFGSLYELTYKVDLKENTNKKNLIDEIRCRNGNLNISLTCTIEDK